MSGTTLDITLSAALQQELDQPGVYAYAEVFGTATGGSLPPLTTIVNNGTIANGGTDTIQLTSGAGSQLTGGKVYLIVQSLPVGTSSTLPGIISNQAMITPATAATYDFGYDSIEITLSGGSSDAANLTSVNGFGLPMQLSTQYGNGTSASVGYAVSGSTIASDISGITSGRGTSTFTEGPLSGTFALSTSPTEANQVPSGTPSTSGAFPQSAWLPYIAALENTAVASQILITGQFNGAKDASGNWHNGGYYAYQLQWDAATGDFWLAPTANSQIQGYIKLTPNDIAENAYSQIGSVGIYASESAAAPSVTIGVGANDQWGAVLAQFLTGFTGGYYGETGNALNPQTTATVNLNGNFNWDPAYAFGANGRSTLGLPSGTQTSDPYSKIFFDNSNSYGSPYSDALMSQYAVGGPLLSVSQPGTSGNVSAVNLTLYAPTETPAGYTQPANYNYIPPASVAAGYAIPAQNASGANIVLNFFSAVANNEGIDLNPNTAITLSILTSDANGVPAWSPVTFSAAAAGNGLGLWQQWQISGSSSTGYSAAPASVPQALKPGSLQILGFPTAVGGVSWYQITVGSGTDAKTYNLYTTTDGTGAFLNPTVSGQQGALAVDGLAQIQAPASGGSVPTFTVSFVKGDTVTYNPALVVENAGPNSNFGASGFPAPAPTAPVVGTAGQSGAFTALANQTSDGAGSADVVTTTVSDGLSFGWTGLNPASGAVSSGVASGWVNGYTNKTNAGDFAVITVANALGQTQTLDAVAGIDGAWQTSGETLELGNGTYTITMQDALAVSSNGTLVPGAVVTSASAPLVLTVDNPANALPANDIVLEPTGSAAAPGGSSTTTVPTGATISGGSVASGVTEVVQTGALLNSVTVLGGATLSVADGGVVTQGVLEAGGTVNIFGAGSDHEQAGSVTFGVSGSVFSAVLSNGAFIDLGSGKSVLSGPAAGSATVNAGSGSTTVHGGAGSVLVTGGHGGALDFTGGTGAATVGGSGFGAETLRGGSGSGLSILIGGSGNSLLAAGTGASGGSTTMVAGLGNSTLVGGTGTQAQLYFTNPLGNSGTAIIAMDSGPSAMIGGSGASTVIGGGGPGIFGFVHGHAGGTETIYNFNSADNLAFGGYGYSLAAPPAETVGAGNDVMTLSDGTAITFVGIDHALF
ncbi:MAG: hypothetical protein HIU92_09935 [Proteobacteria bacterium]|nr:hypothetical protein [Pseudomonadota bacterium]